jgi:hypothetical protein
VRLSSEHGLGWLGLFILAIAVQPVFAEYVVESVGGKPDCVTVTGFEYLGRDDDGRPEWEYPIRRECYDD